jgi:hypothetical protein
MTNQKKNGENHIKFMKLRNLYRICNLFFHAYVVVTLISLENNCNYLISMMPLLNLTFLVNLTKEINK